jgi:hypothetical protein
MVVGMLIDSLEDFFDPLFARSLSGIRASPRDRGDERAANRVSTPRVAANCTVTAPVIEPMPGILEP